MSDRRILIALAFGLAAACGARRPAPPALRADQPIVVLPANNRTGDPLLVSGVSLLDRIASADQVSVADVLAGEVRYQLAEHGVAVVSRERIAKATDGRVPQDSSAAADIAARAKLDALVLYLEIRRWEPDAPVHPAFVIVGVSASLVDPASGKVIWQFDRHPAPVATPGEVTLENAYETAARKAAAEIAASFRP